MARSKRKSNPASAPQKDTSFFEAPKPNKVAPLEPLNQKQQDYMDMISRHPYIIATGLAGTSKTYIPARMAASWFKSRDIQRIIIARPAASMSESLGYFKGTALEKMRSWIAPVLEALEEELGASALNYYLEHEKILAVPMETIKGRSFKDAFIIVDESEDLTLKEVIALVKRIGTNSTMVFAGDISQCDIDYSGLAEFLALREKSTTLQQIVDHISFDSYDEIVRSLACKKVTIGLDEAVSRTSRLVAVD